MSPEEALRPRRKATLCTASSVSNCSFWASRSRRRVIQSAVSLGARGGLGGGGAGAQGRVGQPGRPRLFPGGLVQCCEVVEALGVEGVALSQGCLAEVAGLLVQRQGPGVVPRGLVQQGEVVEALGVVGVALAQRLLR